MQQGRKLKYKRRVTFLEYPVHETERMPEHAITIIRLARPISFDTHYMHEILDEYCTTRTSF